MSDVVLISLEPWDDVWRRNQHFATTALQRDPHLRLLVVEPDHDALHDLTRHRRPRMGARLANLSPAESTFAERVWRWSATKFLPRRLDRGYDARWAGQVGRAAARLGFDRPVLWVNDPRGAAVAQRTGWPTLYDITDDWLAAQRTPAEHARLVADEDYLLNHSAQVTVCSPGILATKTGDSPISLITNGVDPSHWRTPRDRPADLPERAALYVGTLHEDRLDIPLVVATATALADSATVTFVGPNALTPQSTSALLDAGVVLLGPRPYADLPGYLQHAAVSIAPHLVNEFTDSLDPIKLYEYLAAGRPIVSTPIAGFRDRAEVTVAHGPDFAEAVRNALTTGDRSTYVADDLPTWQSQGEQFALALDEAVCG
ncbi:glycosyltransferase involved in cell wall biosynthesis [Branchiibius hedensis]|uniref:Glycosyltransferase involved in cell wall bisynthesis n=1 Tax=Branchiibius hedensis TaxID=672460 RepID=A0A2Y8ZYH4_9MICO|nr:glycosyltransferase [Branchiibius hedensis]PWJ26145.1 glycosyltransferase involved in cell wall biosynthesis [Branchiibius hedensis]SSA34957.1 Glycosyltransferase involved in cell wall bisynthesis [Branchiibius hedensis]